MTFVHRSRESMAHGIAVVAPGGVQDLGPCLVAPFTEPCVHCMTLCSSGYLINFKQYPSSNSMFFIWSLSFPLLCRKPQYLLPPQFANRTMKLSPTIFFFLLTCTLASFSNAESMDEAKDLIRDRMKRKLSRNRDLGEDDEVRFLL